MAKKREKTVLRTIRIPYEIDRIIQNDAKMKRVSINSLIFNLLTKYSEWDRYSERFGRVVLRPQTLKLIIDTLDEETIKDIGNEVGNKIPKEFLLFWFKEINLHSFLEYVSMLCRYAGFSHYELESSEREFTLTLIHDLGEKWSIFLKSVIEKGMISTLFISPKFHISDISVVAKFKSG
ncbi:MAG TPA: hypothetical protein VIY08_02565 [Candidatus Nitrosocosmicus sp.]